MSARGRLLSGLLTIVTALAGFATAGVQPAAAKPATVQYVALGDSYAAGTAINDGCRQSSNGYPALLDSKRRIDLTVNAACPGATTSEVAGALSRELLGDAGLVTLTVGGNDLGVSTVARTCTTGPASPECQAAINNAIALLAPIPPGGESVLGGRLTDLYAAVAKAAPNALIVVTGYPILFEPLPATDPKAAIVRAINEATIALNKTIERAVTKAQAANINITYVDVTAAFAEHGIGSTDPFIHNLPDPEAFHPNAAGYRAYAHAIKTEVWRALLDEHKQLV
ncbi:MAG TPA: SGNH/GDSL hydrolase family protein [Propionibacteriaceae bacterium]|nr:SGNH/GDSL hydrolase family protein [Propionibacteriaceae bacterium]